MRLRWPLAERGNQLAGGLIALPAHAEAAVDDFLQLIAAREAGHGATPHRASDVAAEQHGGDLSHLINVVALLPPANFPPRDLGGRVEHVERIGGDPAAAELVRRDAEVAKLQLLVLADEHVERREVAMQRLSAVQGIERLEHRRDLSAHEALRLRALLPEPCAEIPVLRVFHRETVAHARTVDDREPVEDAQRARLTLEELGEVRLTEPRRQPLRDLDAHLRRKSL